MSINFCISAAELRKALAELEAAEANGFMHCLVVLELRQTGPTISDSQAGYRDLVVRAHPHDPHLDWGCQGVSRCYRFEDGQLVPIMPEPDHAR